MAFEINISLKGKHVFATHQRSLTTPTEVRNVLPRLKIAFPKEDGYEIGITNWEHVGKIHDIKEFE
jgi:hypothetical protein